MTSNDFVETITKTELGISNKKCGKHNLKHFQFLEIEKMTRHENQYLVTFGLTELGISNKKC